MGAQVWMARIEGGDGAILIENGERARPATQTATLTDGVRMTATTVTPKPKPSLPH